MKAVTVRNLRNEGAAVLARVAHGEHLIITKDGDPVARLSPLPRKPFNAEELVARFSRAPQVNLAALRQDLDALLDPSL